MFDVIETFLLLKCFLNFDPNRSNDNVFKVLSIPRLSVQSENLTKKTLSVSILFHSESVSQHFLLFSKNEHTFFYYFSTWNVSFSPLTHFFGCSKSLCNCVSSKVKFKSPLSLLSHHSPAFLSLFCNIVLSNDKNGVSRPERRSIWKHKKHILKSLLIPSSCENMKLWNKHFRTEKKE